MESAGQVFAEEDIRRVFSVARLVNEETAFDRLLPRILDAAIATAGAERGFLALLEEGGPVLRVSRNFSGEDLASPGAGISDRTLSQVLSTGRSLVTTRALQDARFSGFASVHALGLRSVFCVPLRSGGRLLGAIYLDSLTSSPVGIEPVAVLLELLAEHAAVAIEKARVHEDLRRSRDDLAASLARIEELNRRLEGRVEDQAREIARFEGVVAEEESRLAALFPRLLGEGPGLLEVRRTMERAARVDYPVLILGESGTGKEVVATSIHEAGRRSRRPFLKVNCSALAPGLLDAQLFGHARGAFTGADRPRRGFLEAADRGTLFLDEFGELSPDAQARLLRVVETGEFYRLGEEVPTSVDVRLLMATNRDLPALVKEGRFREDLYFRLNTVMIRLPPLRERTRDLRGLAEGFLARAAKEVGAKGVLRFSEEALRHLEERPWPGNIRELLSVVRRAALAADGPEIRPGHLEPPEPPSGPPGERPGALPARGDLPGDLHPRVHAVLSRLRPDETVTFRKYRSLAGVSRATAARDLSDLVRRGLYEKSGRTASVVYRPRARAEEGAPRA